MRIRIQTILYVSVSCVQKDRVKVKFLVAVDRACGQIFTCIIKERPFVIQTTTL